MEERLGQKNRDFDLLGIGWGVRGSVQPIVVELFEGNYVIAISPATCSPLPNLFPYSLVRSSCFDTLTLSPDLIDMYKRLRPETPIVFNHSPESLLWSVEHRIPMSEDCRAARKPGKLLVSDDC